MQHQMYQRHQQALLRHQNEFVTRDGDPIEFILALPTPGHTSNQIPPNFPATRGDLFKMNSARVNSWLTYYGLGVGGTIKVRRIRLASFLGLRPNDL
jgi:hypothetical protein